MGVYDALPPLAVKAAIGAAPVVFDDGSAANFWEYNHQGSAVCGLRSAVSKPPQE